MQPRPSLPVRLLLPALALGVSSVLVACSSGEETPDGDPEPSLATPSGSGEAVPLPEGETAPLELETYRVCLPIGALSEEVLVREEYLEPTEDLTIEAVEPVGAQGIDLVDSWVAPAEGDPGGFFDTMPPSGEGTAPAYRWADRQPAAGAELSGGSGYHLFTHLRQGGSGEIGGIRIRYSSGGEDFDVATTNRYVVSGGC